MNGHNHQASPTTETATTSEPITDVEAALAAHDAAHRAWGDDPGSPDLLAAYVEARQALHAARGQAIAAHNAAAPRPTATPGGGPVTVMTPVIEWWIA